MRKKLYALALAASMLASVAPLGASAAEYVAQLDTNGDGSVSMTDVLLISRYLSGAGTHQVGSQPAVQSKTVVAAHTSGLSGNCNSGVKITSELIAFFKANPEIAY